MQIILNDALAVLRAELEARGAMFLRGLFLEQCASPNIHIWCWDGKGAKARRQEIYPAYKTKRQDASTPIFRGLNLIRDLLGHTKAVQCHADTYEADDLIAHYVRKYQGQGLPIQIRTRDGDLKALVGPGVSCDARSKPLEDVPPKYVHLYKATVGDQSDDVAGIKGFGEGGWKNADLTLLQHMMTGLITGHDITAEQWQEAGLSARAASWAVENPDMVRSAWAVTDFLDPTPKLIEQAGNLNKDAGLTLLKKYRFA